MKGMYFSEIIRTVRIDVITEKFKKKNHGYK